jgi:hypothetical protein
MHNDLKKLWKEASWSSVRLYPRICMEGLKNHDMPHPGYVMSWPRFKRAPSNRSTESSCLSECAQQVSICSQEEFKRVFVSLLTSSDTCLTNVLHIFSLQSMVINC